MSTALTKLRAHMSRDKGATMVEYGIMVALIAAVVIVAVGPLGIAIRDFFAAMTAAL